MKALCIFLFPGSTLIATRKPFGFDNCPRCRLFGHLCYGLPIKVCCRRIPTEFRR
jgi:hypothetical protein